MRKIVSVLLFAGLLTPGLLLAQTVLHGVVRSKVTGEPVPAVSVTVKGLPDGDFTDDKGKFQFSVNRPLPLTLLISSIGYEAREVKVSAASSLDIVLSPAASVGQEVVVSASRTAQKSFLHQ